MKYIYLLCLSSLLFPSLLNAQIGGNEIFDNDYVHEIRINFEEENFWNILTENYTNSINEEGTPTDIPYLMGNIIIDNNTVDSIGIRQKGFSSYFLAKNNLKKSLKLDFNEFVKGKKYDGLKKLNMANGVGDPAMQRDFLAYNMMREAGVYAPRTSYAKVYINDQYWGLYVLIEQVDKSFLKTNFEDGGGDLYKNIGFTTLDWQGDKRTDYENSIKLKTNKKSSDFSDFIEFLDILNNTPDENFADSIITVFNVDHYLKVMALDVMLDNWDSYIHHGRNFYLYHDPISDQFHWIPWDYNFSLNANSDFANTINLPENPDDCKSIQNGSSPYPSTDSIFNEVINIQPDCCLEGWDQSCQGVYDQLSSNGGETNLPNDLGDCQSIVNGTCPYPADDPVYAVVINVDNSCCNNTWGFQCQAIYNAVAVEFQPKYIDFPIILENENLVLVNRILDVPAFKEQYLTYCCEIMENNFNIERLGPIIDYNANLISEAVSQDTNFNHTQTEFQYDIGEGNNSRQTPSLKEYINRRKPLLVDNLMELEYECETNSTKELIVNDLMFDIYPNPTNDHFFIKLLMNEEIKNVDIHISNILGHLQYSTRTMGANIISIPVNNFPPGIYWVEISTKYKRSYRKLIKN